MTTSKKQAAATPLGTSEKGKGKPGAKEGGRLYDWTVEVLRPDESLFYRLEVLARPDETTVRAAVAEHLAMVFPPTDARTGEVTRDGPSKRVPAAPVPGRRAAPEEPREDEDAEE